MSIDASGVVCAVFFAAWFLTTVLCQFPGYGIGKFLKGRDYCAVIPIWTFFAPNPATQDFVLLFRDQHISGTISAWKMFEYRLPSPAIRWLWNPGKRRSKVIHDMATVWLLIAEREPACKTFMLSVPYLCLLHQVCAAPRGHSAIATQMAIGSVHRNQRDAPAEIFATSEFHKL